MAGNKIYVQGSYIDIHDNENVYLSVDKAKVNVNDNENIDDNLNLDHNDTLPEVLAHSELWARVKAEGLVDEHDMPAVSRTEAALLAYMLSAKLGIKHKWKFFEALWQRNNMRNDYNTALEQRKSLRFQDKLKDILH
jgi:hypothetical protein